jgi:hypothetical protein
MIVYWWNNIKHSTTLYKSLQFLNTNKCYPGKIHPLLSINCKSTDLYLSNSGIVFFNKTIKNSLLGALPHAIRVED